MQDQSTVDEKDNTELPQHVAIIMDGNNRWAKKRGLSGREGHRAGQDALEKIIRYCADVGIRYLTVFAFSSENWKRSEEEVSGLMQLFTRAIETKAQDLHQQGVQIRFVGDLSAFDAELQQRMQDVMQLTANNEKAVLQVCVNYGGQWDICDASRRAAQKVKDGEWDVDQIQPDSLQSLMVGGDLPLPDLCIRTGDELRISNFLLWQLAYAELYFSDALWPDFDIAQFQQALQAYAGRQRRFGGSGDNSCGGIGDF